jgi:hypothetical protein
VLPAVFGGVDTAAPRFGCRWRGTTARRIARVRLLSARAMLAWAAATALGSDDPNGSALFDAAVIRAAGRTDCEASMTVPAIAQRTRAATATTRVCRLRANGDFHRRGLARCFSVGCGVEGPAGIEGLARATRFSSASGAAAACAGVSMTSWSVADSSPQKSGAGPGSGAGRESRPSPGSDVGAGSDVGPGSGGAAALADGPNGTRSSGGPSHSRGSRMTLPASGVAARSRPPLASRSSTFRRAD